MKRIVIILCLLMVICITSCSEVFLPSNSTYDSSGINAENTQADDITTKSEISVAVRPEEVGLPAYECKFDKDVWEISKTSQVTLSYNEEIIPTGTHVIRRLANEVPAVPGNFPPSLKLGNSHNGDYEVTFSYFVPKSGFLNFVMFDETNITFANDYLGDQYFWYELKGAGYISIKTTFGVDDDSIRDDKQNRVFVENYQTEVWNKCNLKSVGNEIEIYINDIFITSIKNPDEKRSGHLSLDGAEGIMFKDFAFETQDLIINPTGVSEGQIQQPAIYYQGNMYSYSFQGFQTTLASRYALIGVIKDVDLYNMPTEDFCATGVDLQSGQEVYAETTDCPSLIYVDLNDTYMPLTLVGNIE